MQKSRRKLKGKEKRKNFKERKLKWRNLLDTERIAPTVRLRHQKSNPINLCPIKI